MLATAVKELRVIALALLAACCVVGVGQALAAPLQLYSTGALSGATTVDTLFTVNTTTGAAAPVGPTGQPLGAGGLAYDPTTNTLFATGGASLFSVNTATGAATLVGSTGVFAIGGLAFDTANNTLYGVGCPSPCGKGLFPDFLYSINTSTGAATQLFNLGSIVGVDPGLEYVASSNLLYAIGGTSPTDLYTIDPGTGTVTHVGSPGQFIVGGLALDPNTGIMYTDGSGPGSFSGALFTLNLSNGAATFVGLNGPNTLLSVGGLAFAPPNNNSNVTPEPATLVLTLSGFLGLGGWRIYRRRRRG